MLCVVVAPINFVPSEEGALPCQDVCLCWYNAKITETIGWVYIVIFAS